jgi:hypothetical protein
MERIGKGEEFECEFNRLYGGLCGLGFWCRKDTLPDGGRRCDHRYLAKDEYGDIAQGRCFAAAILKVLITPAETVMATDGSPEVSYTSRPDQAYEAQCAPIARKSLSVQQAPSAILPRPSYSGPAIRAGIMMCFTSSNDHELKEYKQDE